MLDESDLRYMRGVQNDHLPDTAQRLQRVTSNDGLGGQGESWPPAGPTFACRVTDAGPEVPDDLLMRLKGNDGYTITFSQAQVIAYRDRVQVIGRGVYEVVSLDGLGSWETARRVLCVRVA